MSCAGKCSTVTSSCLTTMQTRKYIQSVSSPFTLMMLPHISIRSSNLHNCYWHGMLGMDQRDSRAFGSCCSSHMPSVIGGADSDGRIF